MGSFSADQLRELAVAYCAATGISLSLLGERAAGNYRMFVRLADGYGCTLDCAERATRWFLDNWPKGTPWPASVPKPRKVAA